MFFKKLREGADGLVKAIGNLRQDIQKIESLMTHTSWRIDELLSIKKEESDKAKADLEKTDFERETERFGTIVKKTGLLTMEYFALALNESEKSGLSKAKILYIIHFQLPKINFPYKQTELLEAFKFEILDNAEEIGKFSNFSLEEMIAVNDHIYSFVNGTAINGKGGLAMLSELSDSNSDDPLVKNRLAHIEGLAEVEEEKIKFEDLLIFDDHSIRILLREIQSDSLILALKGASDKLKEKIFVNMSKRAAEMLREDLESKGPVRLSECEAERRDILKIVMRLADEGQIMLVKANEKVVI